MRVALTCLLMAMLPLRVAAQDERTGKAEERPLVAEDVKTEVGYLWDEVNSQWIEVSFQDHRGEAVVGGDLIVAKTKDMRSLAERVRKAGGSDRYPPPDRGSGRDRIFGFPNPNGRWKNGVIPYEVHKNSQFAIAKYWSTIDAMMRRWEQGGVKFRPREGKEKPYLTIYQSTEGVEGKWYTGWYSPQTRSVHLWPVLVGHELGHALGLFHEHQRCDRSKYVTVYVGGAQYDIIKAPLCGPYERPSVMHYAEKLGKIVGKGGKIEKKDNEITDRDIASVRAMYAGASCGPTPKCP